MVIRQFRHSLACCIFALLTFSNQACAEKNTAIPQTIHFNHDWLFYRGDDETAMQPACCDSNWESVQLPHYPRVTALRQPWKPDNEGINWYRKHFRLPVAAIGCTISLTFEGADQVADVWINGRHLLTHVGSYLPFMADLTSFIHFQSENVIAVRVDNHADREIPVYGNWISYGGLYRDVWLTITGRLHITDPLRAERPAGGGIFVTYPQVSDSSAQIRIQTEIVNEFDKSIKCLVRSTLLDAAGGVVAVMESANSSRVGERHTFDQIVTITDPHLWHPDHPYLYRIHTEIFAGSVLQDVRETRIGIRRIRFTRENGFEINGQRLMFMGTNRVQDYPYVAWAFPEAAQKRDVRLLKEGGFQYIRTSHNPQDPAFLDACDEMGMLVMDCLPGFQFVGGGKFRERSFQNMREIIRRDRNHPCLVLWELSLNETDYDSSFARTAMNIGHEEFPGDQCYVAGWKFPSTYDVFLRASQHGARGYAQSTPLVISEYGHWEFGGSRSSSDAERRQGEAAMLAQAHNHLTSLDLNRRLPFLCGDGLWVGIDFQCYPSGVLDYFRLPKFSYYFYQSQRDPGLQSSAFDFGPMVFIANYWTPQSPSPVTVFSNCDQVDLLIDGVKVASQRPDTNADVRHLLHPPFTFHLPFKAGELKAVGYVNGVPRAQHSRTTPGKAQKLMLDSNLKSSASADGDDLFFIYATLADADGNPVYDVTGTVAFRVTGPAILVSPPQIETEAGVAAALVRTRGPAAGRILITAETTDLPPALYVIDYH